MATLRSLRRPLTGVTRLSRAFSSQPAPRLQTQLFINNEFVKSSDGTTFPTYNPSTGEVLSEVYEASKSDVDRAVHAAVAAGRVGSEWHRMTPRARGACITKLAQLIDDNRIEFAQIEAMNNGKTYAQASTVDIPASATMLRYWAGWSDKLTGQTIPIGNDHFVYTLHEPVGVCALIVPWNLPMIAIAAKLGPSLTCGNTVVLKTAEQTPLTGLRLAELVKEAGFPAGVINILSGNGPTTGQALIEHPLVNKISFTGSVEVGRHIAGVAAKNIKKVTLELGGKNPVIVCDDADLDVAVESVHNGLFWNEGEACASGSRIYVHSSIYKEFVRRSVERAKRRTVGHSFSNVDQGAQCGEEQFDKIMKYIEIGQKEGAKLQCGGHRVGDKGYFIAPTIFSDVSDHMRIFQEEIFGPVMSIAQFDSLDDVIEKANATPFGLAAGVFTRDIKKGSDLTRRLKSGMVFWNCYHVVDVSAPFGGMKASGYGREGGTYGLLPYLEVKNIAQRIS